MTLIGVFVVSFAWPPSICCVCVCVDSVSGVHSVQLHSSHPAVRTSYRPTAGDSSEHDYYSVSALAHPEEDFCSCGCEHPGNQYSSLNDRWSRRRIGRVDGLLRTGQPGDWWLPPADAASHFSTHSRYNAFVSDQCSLVQQRTQFFSSLPASQHCCHCFNVMPPGLCKTFPA